MQFICKSLQAALHGAAAAAGLLSGEVAADADPQADPDYGRAVRAAQQWTAAHPKGWNLTLKEVDPTRGFRRADTNPARCGAESNNLIAASLTSAGTTVELIFDCAVAQATTLEALRAAYRFTVLRALPHGLKLPTWSFEVMTPASSFSHGVELVAWRDGRLDVHISTPLYAIYGRSKVQACKHIPDVPTPPRCFIHNEHRIPLMLTLSAPFSPAVLR
jgi:hypothetical protein